MIVDDQAVVRAGIAAIVAAEPGLVVAGQAGDGAEAVRLAAELRPDVVLMDLRMPGMDGLAATERLSPHTKVVMLTTFGQDRYVFAALRAGAAGFLLKDSEPERVIDAIRVVAAGDGLLDPAVTRRMIEAFTTGAAPPDPRAADQLASLTPREREVLAQIARGLSNAEIADALGIRPSTVKDHVNVLLGKLGVRDRVQATIFAYDAGLVRPRSAGNP